MKKILLFIIMALPLLAVSCSKDNYAAPQETFCGKFIDKATGEPFQTAIGNTGIQIRMMEYSWSDNPQPYDFNAMMDGRFNNTKVFAGEYGVKPTGAFVPLEEERIVIKGKVEKTYEVEPLLRVEWVGEPKVTADGFIEVQVKVNRGTNNPDYQQALAEAWLFVSEIDYVGDFCYSPNFSTQMTGAAINAVQFGNTYTVRSKKALPKYARPYFVRFGVRTTKQFDGVNRYNYTTIKEVQNPGRN